MGRHTQYLKDFDIKEHKLMFGGIGACILLMIIGAIIGVFAHANMQGAANDYDSVNKTVTNIVQDQRVSNTIRYIHNHNAGAVDLGQSLSDLNDGMQSANNFALSCAPGDAITSPEYHNARVMSDTAFFFNWVTPVFSYSNLDEYFANYAVMQSRFDEASATHPDMNGCKQQFFLYVMPDAQDLNVNVQDSTERSKYNCLFNVVNTYCLNANFSVAPYAYTYMAEIAMTSQNPENGSRGNPTGEQSVNFVVIYTIERNEDGTPVMTNIRFSSLQGYTL